MILRPLRYSLLAEDGCDFADKAEALESHQETRSTCGPSSGVLSAVLLVIAFVFCALLIDSRNDLEHLRRELKAAKRDTCNIQNDEHIKSDDGHDLLSNSRGVFPKFGLENRPFGLNHEYEANGPATNEAWEIFLDLSGPYLAIAHAQHMGLPSSKRLSHDPTASQLYGVSALHQLHCLAILRDLYISSKSGVISRYDGTRHPLHCFDYIREGILCAGDTTLEPGTRHFDHQSNQTVFIWEGVGIAHQCRDWTAIAAYLTERRLSGQIDLRLM